MLGSVGAFLPELTQSEEDVPDDRDYDESGDHVTDVGEGLVELRPLTAEGVPGAGQRDDVDQRADQVQHAEAQRRHLHDPGHDRRECPHHRQHPGDRQRPRAPPDEEPLRASHVVLRDQNVPSPPVHERLPASPAHPVGDERADELGQGSQDDDQDQARVLVRSGDGPGRDRAAEQERQLGRDRDAHGLKHAKQDDGVDGMRDEETLHAPISTAS